MPIDIRFKSDDHLQMGKSRDVGISRTAAGVAAIGSGAFAAVDGTVSCAQEIINDANGGQWISGYTSELITLSTSGLTTDSVGNLLPANSVIQAVVAEVVTTITTATNWAVGDGTTAARFVSADSTLTAGEKQIGINHLKGGVSTDAAGPTQVAAAKVRITCTGSNPGAGQVRVTVFYQSFVAPTS